MLLSEMVHFLTEPVLTPGFLLSGPQCVSPLPAHPSLQETEPSEPLAMGAMDGQDHEICSLKKKSILVFAPKFPAQPLSNLCLEPSFPNMIKELYVGALRAKRTLNTDGFIRKLAACV